MFGLRLSSVLLFAAACGSPAMSSPMNDENGPLTPDEDILTPQQLLGKRLFEDGSLSEPAGASCASCHEAAVAYTGNHGSPVGAVPLGSHPGALGRRNAATLMYATFAPQFSFIIVMQGPGQFTQTPTGGLLFDGAAANLAIQAQSPLLDPLQLGNPDKGTALGKVEASAYSGLFRAVNGQDVFDAGDVAYDRIADALAAFEKTDRFHPFTSKFDDWLRGGAPLGASEQRGLELFKDPEKGNCISCHAGEVGSADPTRWLFTNYTYANLGVPRNPDIPANADANFYDLGLCRQNGLESRAPFGFDVETLCGHFRVPTLRNVARTAPYMHNGKFAGLRDAVAFHVTRETNPERWYPLGSDGLVRLYDDLPTQYLGNVDQLAPFDRGPGEPPRLSDEEIDVIVGFLMTLSDR